MSLPCRVLLLNADLGLLFSITAQKGLIIDLSMDLNIDLFMGPLKPLKTAILTKTAISDLLILIR